jgi:sialic acid synthase SpsE
MRQIGAFNSLLLRLIEALDISAHKIASSETTNLAFLHYVASKGKPLIISTGMCDMIDVEEAINICLSVGNQNIILLQCGAMYPLPSELANLRVLSSFAERFCCPVGFSDHTLGQTAAIAAVGLGATVFEKHFTLDRNAQGPDHFYALEPGELKVYIASLHEAYQALGSAVKKMLPKEQELGRREGLYAERDLAAGEVLGVKDINSRRPAVGLRARYASAIVGARIKKSLKKDAPITWDLLEF